MLLQEGRHLRVGLLLLLNDLFEAKILHPYWAFQWTLTPYQPQPGCDGKGTYDHAVNGKIV